MDKLKGKMVKIKTINQLYKEDPNFREKPPSWPDEMDKYAGRPAKIICHDNDADITLDVDKGEFSWHVDWLKFYIDISVDNKLFEL